MKAQLLKPDDRKRIGGRGRNSSAVANEERNCVAAAKNGDSVAFSILYTRSAGMVFSIARRIMPTNEDAQDVVQESFRLAFTHLKNFKGHSRFSTWLTRIVTNAALMRLRENSVRRELSLNELAESQGRLSPFDLEDQSPDPEQVCAQKERHRMLRKAVNELTPKMRKAIELRDLDELSNEETARIMGVSVSSVKARVFHGRRRLRRLLKRMNSIPMYRKRTAAIELQAGTACCDSKSPTVQMIRRRENGPTAKRAHLHWKETYSPRGLSRCCHEKELAALEKPPCILSRPWVFRGDFTCCREAQL